MILEVAILDVVPGREDDFQQAFAQAQNIIASVAGNVDHQLLRCREQPNCYILLVN